MSKADDQPPTTAADDHPAIVDDPSTPSTADQQQHPTSAANEEPIPTGDNKPADIKSPTTATEELVGYVCAGVQHSLG